MFGLEKVLYRENVPLLPGTLNRLYCAGFSPHTGTVACALPCWANIVYGPVTPYGHEGVAVNEPVASAIEEPKLAPVAESTNRPTVPGLKLSPCTVTGKLPNNDDNASEWDSVTRIQNLQSRRERLICCYYRGEQKWPAKQLQGLIVLKEKTANCRRPVRRDHLRDFSWQVVVGHVVAMHNFVPDRKVLEDSNCNRLSASSRYPP